MSEAVADASDATKPVPTVKGPFVLPLDSWVSCDSILIKCTAVGVEQAAKALCPRAQGERMGRLGAWRPPENGEQGVGGEPRAGSCKPISSWLVFRAEEPTCGTPHPVGHLVDGTFRDTLGKLNPRAGKDIF